MKIALVTPYDYPYPGGVTEHIRHLDREFQARGHVTRIIAPSTERQDALDSNVIKVSGDVLQIPVNGSTARIALAPEVSRRAEEILNEERFDIVHLHEPEVPLLGWAMLHASRAINVATFHAYSEKHTFEQYTQPVMEWVHAHLHGRIFVSRAARDFNAPYLTGDYRIIPNGIDVARFTAPEIRPISEFDDGRPNILFVGRLDARKGFVHLLHAYPRIKRAVPDARLLVVGAFGDEEKARLAEYVRGADLRDVHLIGRVSDTELPRYYRTATVFSAPSTGGESFGIVLLEAMAAGLPVVASDIAGYRSVMHNGAEGILVPPGDEKAIAVKITELLQDTGRRAAMAARGRTTAAQYDWSVVAPRVLDYYQELIRMRPTGKARSFALMPQHPLPKRKISGMGMALDGLMKGLSVLETKSSSDETSPKSSSRLGEARLVLGSPLPVHFKVSARLGDLVKVEFEAKP